VALWTQRASFSWRQNLNFYERRYDILQELEDKALLRRFQDRKEAIAVRLQGPHQMVIFGEDELFIGMFKPDAAIDVIREAVDVICGALEPESSGIPVFKFQWLNTWNASYNDARRGSAEAFLGTEHPVRVVDFALLLDAKADEPFDDCHLEFGIVEGTEAPRRLARGLLPSAEDPHDSPPGLWSSEELPAVSIFCDVYLDAWSLVDSSDGIVANMFATMEQARSVADGFMASMLKPLEDLAQ
jgi:hypothetical protein